MIFKLGGEITPGLRVPGMALLGYRPFGPSPSRSTFPFRYVRHPSEHSSLALLLLETNTEAEVAVAVAGVAVVALS